MAAAIAVATFLCGCGASGSPAPATWPDLANVDRSGSSWMQSDGYSGALLYVSDPGANVVNVLTYPNGKRIGKLTGFDQPRGECVDRSGNVYTTNEGASNVLEYAHGGTTPIATIDDTGQKPYDCSVNLNARSLSSRMAVLNIGATNGGAGSVSVYGGREAGTYKLTQFSSLAFLGYTYQGEVANLFVDGLDSSGKFQCALLAPHRTKFRIITVPHKIGAPGAIWWDGMDVAIGNQDHQSGTTVIDRFSYRSSQLTFVGATPLSTSVEQFYPDGGAVIGPYTAGTTVGFWNYPAGGSPTKTLDFFVAPFGAVVSRAP